MNFLEKFELYRGLYAGVVESNSDPELIGRLKVRVPHVYGPTGAEGSLDTSNLPWAFPAGLPAGGSPYSGGISWLPEPGDQVYVQFLDGEPEKPVWFWGNQNLRQRQNLNLHHYENGHVIRAGLTRYGHTVEFNQPSVIATSKSGYAVILDEGEIPFAGMVELKTARGQHIQLSDAEQVLEVVANEVEAVVDRHVTVMAESYDLEAFTGDFLVRAADEVKLEAGASVEITFGQRLKLGSGIEPMVLGNQFVQLMEHLLVWLNTHVHSNGNMGSPTGTPVMPWFPSPAMESTISKTIFGQ